MPAPAQFRARRSGASGSAGRKLYRGILTTTGVQPQHKSVKRRWRRGTENVTGTGAARRPWRRADTRRRETSPCRHASMRLWSSKAPVPFLPPLCHALRVEEGDRRGPLFVVDLFVTDLFVTDRRVAVQRVTHRSNHHQAFSSSSTRWAITLSTRPNSWAPSAVKNWSRSSASSIFLIGWPVCLT
jgi:hypothetical protein